jgi:hypothetical protein
MKDTYGAEPDEEFNMNIVVSPFELAQAGIHVIVVPFKPGEAVLLKNLYHCAYWDEPQVCNRYCFIIF